MGDQRIATGRLDQRISRLDAARTLCLFNHSQSDSVLDASSSIEILQLRIYIGFNPEALWEPVESDEGRVPDMLSDGIDSRRRHDGSGYGGHGNDRLENQKGQQCRERQQRQISTSTRPDVKALSQRVSRRQ